MQEALKLISDGLESKLISVLEDLLSSTPPEQMVCLTGIFTFNLFIFLWLMSNNKTIITCKSLIMGFMYSVHYHVEAINFYFAMRGLFCRMWICLLCGRRRHWLKIIWFWTFFSLYIMSHFVLVVVKDGKSCAHSTR